MQHKNFFNARYFSPRACSIFGQFVTPTGDVIFQLFEENGIVSFNVSDYKIFLPKSILADGFTFGKTNSQKVIASFRLSNEDLEKLIKFLGGSFKKVNPKPRTPTIGDLLK